MTDGAAGGVSTSGRPTGVISDQAIDLLRARLGIPEPNPAPPHYRHPGTDTFRIAAQACGDDNPLWCDPAYGPTTRWGEPIASPALVGGDTLIGEDEVTAVPEDKRELMRGDPLRGVHAFYAASSREWWAPLTAGQRVLRRNALVGVYDKPSEFAGRAVHEWSGQVFGAAGGPLLSGQYKLMIRTQRDKARSKGKYAKIEPYVYTDEEIARIEEQVLAERCRGAQPRWWEDVAVGDIVGPLVKGPLTVTDIVCWHVGMGMGLYKIGPLRLGVHNRRRIPRFYHRDEFNVPDVMQRVHWDPEFARRSGNPTTFDYGRMRETWLIHACTDWMGDDAWLWKLECQFRAFNYVGDTQWVSGIVERCYLADGGRPAVDLQLRSDNQRGAVSTLGTATILLPSKEYGAVRLPDPPGNAHDLAAALDAVVEQFAHR
jgi:acyl dehydratase